MNLSYTITEGVSGFARAKLAAFASITTITISLILLGLYFIVSINSARVINLIRERVEMEAFLQEPLSRQQLNDIKQNILTVNGVDSVLFVSKEQAAKIFREEFGEDITRILDFNPLPQSYKIFLKDEFKTTDAGNQIYTSLKSIRGIDDIVYRKDLIEFLEKRSQVLNLIGLIVGIIIGISAIFLVSNTIRLAIYSKRKIIRTMKLVGATRWFIRLPFILEGILQGFAGGITSSLILYALIALASRWMSAELAEFLKINLSVYGLIILLGMMLGFFGSIISIRKFISESIVK
jgi:cell division transport system permease protein